METPRSDHDHPPRETAAAPFTQALREAILSGELPPGARLPAERDLAERYGVTRLTVRSALARLGAEHLLAVRQGSGYTVRDYLRSGGLDLVAALASLARTRGERVAIVRDLLLVRRQLARAMLERLVEVADAEGLAAVDAAIDRFAAVAAAKAPVAELVRADLDVGAALVAATKSRVLQLCFNPVAALTVQLPDLQAAMYRAPASNIEAYRMLVALVRARSGASIDVVIDQLRDRDDATIAELSRSRAAREGKRRS
jgi:DNA-binding FadR family transcriptional regulator